MIIGNRLVHLLLQNTWCKAPIHVSSESHLKHLKIQFVTHVQYPCANVNPGLLNCDSVTFLTASMGKPWKLRSLCTHCIYCYRFFRTYAMVTPKLIPWSHENLYHGHTKTYTMVTQKHTMVMPKHIPWSHQNLCYGHSKTYTMVPNLYHGHTKTYTIVTPKLIPYTCSNLTIHVLLYTG